MKDSEYKDESPGKYDDDLYCLIKDDTEMDSQNVVNESYYYKKDEYWIIKMDMKILTIIHGYEKGLNYIFEKRKYKSGSIAGSDGQKIITGLLKDNFLQKEKRPDLNAQKSDLYEYQKQFKNFTYFENEETNQFIAISDRKLPVDRYPPAYYKKYGQLHRGASRTDMYAYFADESYELLAEEILKEGFVQKPVISITLLPHNPNENYEVHFEINSRYGIFEKREKAEPQDKKTEIDKDKAKLTVLEELDLSGNKNVNVLHLSLLTSLRTLKTGEKTVENLDFLIPLSGLTHLDISEIETKDIRALAHLKNITQLKMKACPNLDFSVLNDLPYLMDFSLSGSLDRITISGFSFFRRLRKLSLANTCLHDISFLSELTQLESLDLSFNEIEDVSPLSSLQSLQILYLTHNNVRDIRPLAGLKQLMELNVNYNEIADQSAVSGFPSGTKISLDGQRLLHQNDTIMTEWPSCMSRMQPMDVKINSIPDYFLKIYQGQGIDDINDIFIPVKNIVPLGNCPASHYRECPNLPEHHRDEEGKSLDSGIGKYFWFDFDLVSADKTTTPLRMVYCYGCGDTNDGMWGAFWDRQTKDRVADIKSTGDMETTIAVLCNNFKTRYKDHNMWIPTILYYFKDPSRYSEKPDFLYAHDWELEKVLAVAIILSEPFRFKDKIKIDQVERKLFCPQQGVVFFKDNVLKKSISRYLNKTEGSILVDEVKSIENLSNNHASIIDLTGLEYFTSLVNLDLSDNSIRDITPLSRLTKLKKLNVSNNFISDTTPL